MMGLDMYAYKVPKEARRGPFDFDDNNKGYNEICYWRKHHDLHGWMENLYRKKGGEGEFNCVVLELTREDLEELATAVKNDELPESAWGFYSDCLYGETVEKDLKFIETAKKLIDEGWCIYYDSWW